MLFTKLLVELQYMHGKRRWGRCRNNGSNYNGNNNISGDNDHNDHNDNSDNHNSDNDSSNNGGNDSSNNGGNDNSIDDGITIWIVLSGLAGSKPRMFK